LHLELKATKEVCMVKVFSITFPSSMQFLGVKILYTLLLYGIGNGSNARSKAFDSDLSYTYYVAIKAPVLNVLLT